MARILIIQHRTEPLARGDYAIWLLVERWAAAGHSIKLASGWKGLPEAEVAIVHVNLSVVPLGYAEAARRCPLALNANALDIRKRLVSRHLVDPGDGWEGPVIVKTNLNCNGVPEIVAELRRRGTLTLPEGAGPQTIPYTIYPHRSAVPDQIWSIPDLIVERFLPETDGEDYYLRTWIFFGPEECCRRFRARKPLIKGADYEEVTPVEVPAFLRAERERLGLDYGKFDFVMHDGEPILLDVNKTMGTPSESRPELRQAYAELAPGLDALLSSAGVAGKQAADSGP